MYTCIECLNVNIIGYFIGDYHVSNFVSIDKKIARWLGKEGLWAATRCMYKSEYIDTSFCCVMHVLYLSTVFAFVSICWGT